MSVRSQEGAGRDLAELFIRYLREDLKLSETEIEELLKRRGDRKGKPEDVTIPTSVFSRELSCLETVIKYLKENKSLKVSEIANLLNRNIQTVYTTLRQAAKKHPGRFWQETGPVERKSYRIPVSVIATRQNAVMESIIIHLKTAYNLSFADIAGLLRRAPNTIWTTYNRAMQKKQAKTSEESK